MLQFSANQFFWSGRALRSIQGDCLAGSATVLDGEVVFATGRDLDETARNKALCSLESVGTACRNVGMTMTADMIGDLLTELRGDSRYSFDWLLTQTDAIERLAERELKARFFLYVPSERARFWPSQKHPHLFGLLVAERFPSASFDIASSGTCLATMTSTASVFHLMRVMEIGLRVLGTRFGVSLAHTNWASGIEQIESRIRDMHKDPVWKAIPDHKDQQSFYAQAASHFAIVKDAWRIMRCMLGANTQ